jgi:hypothetical protein
MAIVHISYSRDNIAHLGRVLELARRLQGAGMETQLHELRDAGELAHDPEPAWRHNPADGPVLVVCTPAYLALTDASGSDQHRLGAEVSAVAVLFDAAHVALLPSPLARRRPYVIVTETDFQRLLSDLRGGGLNPVGPAMAARPADQGDGAVRARPEPMASAGSPRPIERPTLTMPVGRPATKPQSGKLARLRTALRGVFSWGPSPVDSLPRASPPLARDDDDTRPPGMPTRAPVETRQASAVPTADPITTPIQTPISEPLTHWPDDPWEASAPDEAAPMKGNEQAGAAMAPPDKVASKFTPFDDTWPGAPLEQAAPVVAAAEPPEAAAAAAASRAQAEPVWFGATSPRRAVPGDQLTAALAVYIASRRQSAQDKLQAFGEPGDRQVLDLAPDGDACWALGAPVTVTLSGRHVSVQPSRREFLWNGKENLAAFEVSVAPDAPPGKVTLTFQVALAGVPMAFVPMPMEIGTSGIKPELTPAAVEQQQRAPRSAFASYSSADAAEVTGRLSTLQRWSPTLAIFQDCLDLQPNETFKAQLEHEIASRDVFLLFWSTHAAASQWVRWEYDQARAAKGLDAIVPMPLQDPSIAHPPAEFETAHLRDRFMMAGYALQAIRQQAAAVPPG